MLLAATLLSDKIWVLCISKTHEQEGAVDVGDLTAPLEESRSVCKMPKWRKAVFSGPGA